MLARIHGPSANFFREIWLKRELIIDLAINDFRSSYLGSAAGVMWLFLEPLFYMLIMWFFFTKAVKFKPSGDTPYVAWLMTSMVAWNFFSSVFAASSQIFRSHSYLLKRWGFNMSILPLVKVLSCLAVHGIFLLILFIIYALSGIGFSLYWFQSLYYLFCLCVLLIGISWITASVSLFLRDVSNAAGIILQIGFWISPIFWDLNSYPEQYRFIMVLNPLYYPLEGYRKSFLYHIPFWQDVSGAAYFWLVSLVILFVGFLTYKRLRPFFGDVA